MSAVCTDESKLQGILHIFGPVLELPRKSDKSDAMVDTTGAVFMPDVQGNTFFTVIQ